MTDQFLVMTQFQRLFPELSEQVQKYRRMDNHTALIILFSGARYVFRWESTKKWTLQTEFAYRNK
nr:MAG TPA: hypothetical protein [Caudoviricetes sp.]